MSSLALYRTYRPGRFADVVGQEHVTVPLMRALANDRVHHAYLFSGPRGCGKTSSARILARSLNCEKGPTDEPCGSCQSCLDLAPNGPGNIDVVELDAATHGLVDDARDLREKAHFAPVASQFKIYIIDEAHQLGPGAANALLKLIEEPPAHLKFIFATTAPDKIIGTIRSRTHHYPFRLIPTKTLQQNLGWICEQEGVPIEPAALALVARAGAGSARDAQSILGQLIAGAGDDGVTYDLAVALLGFTDAAMLDQIVEAIAAGDGRSVFAAVDQVMDAGHDPRRFLTDLLERFRDLIVLRAAPDAVAVGLLDLPPDQAERMAAQAARFGPTDLVRLAAVVDEGITAMKGATPTRLQLELVCARLLLPGADDTVSGIQARLDRVERRLTGGEPITPAAPSSAEAPSGGADVPGGLSPRAAAFTRTQPPDTPVAPGPAGPGGTVPAPSAAETRGAGANAPAGARERSGGGAQPAGADTAPTPAAERGPGTSAEPEQVTSEPATLESAAPESVTTEPGPDAPSPAEPGSGPSQTEGPPPTAGPGPSDAAREPAEPGSDATAGPTTAPAGPGNDRGPETDPARATAAGPRPAAGRRQGADPVAATGGGSDPATETDPLSETDSLSGTDPAAPSAPPPAAAPEAQPAAPSAGPAAPSAGAPAAPQQPIAASGAAGGVADMRRMWPEVLVRLKEIKRTPWSLISQESTVADVANGVLTLAFRQPTLRDTFARREDFQACLQQAIKDVLLVDLRVEAIVDPSSDPSAHARGGTGHSSGPAQGQPARTDPSARGGAPGGGQNPGAPTPGGAPTGGTDPATGRAPGPSAVPGSPTGPGSATHPGAPAGSGRPPAGRAAAAKAAARRAQDQAATTAAATTAAATAATEPQPTHVVDDSDADPDNDDLADDGVSERELLERTLGATVIAEIEHE